MTVWWAWLGVLLMVAGRASGAPSPVPQAPGVKTDATEWVLAFGDMGTAPSDFQLPVARAMNEVCQKLGCGLNGLLLGDNFYPDGVKDVNDPQFIEKFYKPYRDLIGRGMVFHPALGNHDYHQNPTAQIEYSSKAGYWVMPAAYYKFSLGAVDFFVVDSNQGKDAKGLGPTQVAWLRDALATATGTTRVVIGHHPVFSVGEHGDTANLKEEILPILCGAVDVYLAGHDHDLQVLEADLARDCGAKAKRPLTFIVSGGGGKAPRPHDGSNPRKVFYYGGNGFARVGFAKGGVRVVMHGEDGRVLFDKAYPSVR